MRGVMRRRVLIHDVAVLVDDGHPGGRAVDPPAEQPGDELGIAGGRQAEGGANGAERHLPCATRDPFTSGAYCGMRFMVTLRWVAVASAAQTERVRHQMAASSTSTAVEPGADGVAADVRSRVSAAEGCPNVPCTISQSRY